MAQRASELIGAAETLYGRELTPEITREIGEQLRSGIAEALGFLANIIMCDYLNRWNNADERNLVDAQIAVDAAKRYSADVAIVHYAQGFIYRAEDRHPEAEAAFQKSRDLNPGSVRTKAQLAAEMLYNGKFDEALNQIDLAINEGTGNPALGMFQWIKGRTLFFKEQYKEAIPCLQASVDSWPNLWYNWLYLASAYAQDGDTQKAGELLVEFKRRFQGYDTITEVIAAEQTNPNKNPEVEKGRAAFHKGLKDAGMSWN
ncbi:MAG: tetratricopeptide repeat protein [Alphaproteobacteria bacterium]